jgi:hypothetical protein
LSLYKQELRISEVTIESGIGLVGDLVLEDGVLLIGTLTKVVDGLFFSFNFPPQLAADDSVVLIKPGL